MNKSLIIFASLLLKTIMCFATTKMDIRISKNSSKILSVTLNSVEIGEKIKVVNTAGEILFLETINKPGYYTKDLSLSDAPYGLYFVENISSRSVYIEPIMVSKYRASLVTEEEKTYVAPRIEYNDNLLVVSAKNNKRVETFIDIYNSEGVIIYNSNILKTKFVQKKFNTFVLRDEYIRVSVTINGYNFNEKINI